MQKKSTKEELVAAAARPGERDLATLAVERCLWRAGRRGEGSALFFFGGR